MIKNILTIFTALVLAGTLSAQDTAHHATGGNDTVKATTLQPAQGAEVNYNSGIADFGKGDFNAAVKDFDQAITLKPDFEQAYLNRGNAKFKLKDYPGASADYTKATTLNTTDDKAWYGLGMVQNISGTKEQAIDAFSKAILANNKNAESYFYRGRN